MYGLRYSTQRVPIFGACMQMLAASGSCNACVDNIVPTDQSISMIRSLLGARYDSSYISAGQHRYQVSETSHFVSIVWQRKANDTFVLSRQKGACQQSELEEQVGMLCKL